MFESQEVRVVCTCKCFQRTVGYKLEQTAWNLTRKTFRIICYVLEASELKQVWRHICLAWCWAWWSQRKEQCSSHIPITVHLTWLAKQQSEDPQSFWVSFWSHFPPIYLSWWNWFFPKRKSWQYFSYSNHLNYHTWHWDWKTDIWSSIFFSN